MSTDKTPILERPNPSTKEKCEPLFEEEWSKIYPDELVITWYWFPTAMSKRVDIKQIKGIYYRKQCISDDLGETKGWGMSFTPCWWACDIKRGFRSDAERRGFYNVAIDIGDGTMKGFTTNNLHPFLKILRSQCGPGVVCREGFPW
ncbi:hypothetical protein PFISCL1PPCAC_11134 [Pristionchus fissidentatus]|uniref:Uncharacterized protein n=1 Tax=Pristionchus fissidentatus TaxID=1538716 RepID=A0AAV5VJC0_9BILA|nr:hypothetical protein PFISCL1PPCAC_11134 [Pristionchus fissidentatus]